MTFAAQATLAADSAFRDKVRVAMVTAALQIVGEAAAGDNIVEDKRQYLGVLLLADSASYVDRFAWAVAANPAITSSSLDSDIQFTVNSVWSDVAGVRTGD